MYLAIKRLSDILVASIALLVLSPLFIVVIIVLKLTGEGEIFYFQERIGLNQKKFKIWKFATMLKNSMDIGAGSITLRNDFRVTKVGHYLRISKINELPQIINVLIGDISIVGPRPLVDKTFNDYSEHVRNVIYTSKPGITGIGSIVFRDEEKLISSSDMNPHDFYHFHIAPYKGKLELWYLDNKSTFTDFKLIFLTAWVIIFPKSKLPFKVFKDLPPKPESLVV
ncbi:MAG TPA: sugar transferase [Bacteroidetes bacterium]|nr:sugar transferase [Bacteroidota bacterium]